VNFPDGFRAQYYLRKLIKAQERISEALSSLKSIWPEVFTEEIVVNVCEQLVLSLDQLILPTVVGEIVEMSDSGNLFGNTPIQRYQSFFLQDKKWTETALAVPEKYPFLFKMMDIIIDSTVRNIETSLFRLKNDYGSLRSSLLPSDVSLSGIRFGISDRHVGGQQAVIFTFELGQQIVYKPVDLTLNMLFADFIDFLDLKTPFDLKTPKVLSKGDYGWVEYIDPDVCKNKDALKRYYQRAGVLLAVADALNYCDGHMENLIAHGEYPVLIDLETLFHVFGKIDPDLGERSILFTGLIEKPPEEAADKGFTAAFQAISVSRYELLYPYAIHDHTDQIAVRYRGFSNVTANNSPIMDGVIYTPAEFVEDFVSGFQYGYSVITNKAFEWLNLNNWWLAVSNAKARQLIRHTLYYELLSRKMQQPSKCVSKQTAFETIYPLLNSDRKHLSELVSYEVNDILNMDVPYFYHFPNSLDLYDGCGHCYGNYFENSAIQEICDQTRNRSESYLSRNIAIIRNVLKASPEPIEI